MKKTFLSLSLLVLTGINIAAIQEFYHGSMLGWFMAPWIIDVLTFMTCLFFLRRAIIRKIMKRMYGPG